MRLRRKPWIDEAIKDYTDILYLEEPTRLKGKWNTLFPEPENPIHVEFGTGKGRFISRMASVHPDINYIGMEVQEGVIYYAAKKTAEMDPPVANVRLILGDVKHIQDIFARGEVSVIYLNFSDPWPKARHAKRRLTYREFLKKYEWILKEGGEIRVWVGNTLNGKKIIVTDTGIGIPKNQQERIFERFYRVDKSHSKEIGGTGLGLSIVKHGAILHNAKIHVDSELGKGTRMELTF